MGSGQQQSSRCHRPLVVPRRLLWYDNHEYVPRQFGLAHTTYGPSGQSREGLPIVSTAAVGRSLLAGGAVEGRGVAVVGHGRACTAARARQLLGRSVMSTGGSEPW